MDGLVPMTRRRSMTRRSSMARRSSASDTQRRSRRRSSTGDMKRRSSVSESSDVLKPASVRTLIQFLSPLDKVLLLLCMICELGAGSAFPLMMLFFGSSIDSMGNLCADQELDAMLITTFIQMAILAAITGLLRVLSTVGIATLQKKQMTRYRIEYMRSIIRQDIGWYDMNNPQELSTTFGDSLALIKKGLGFTMFGTLAGQGGTLIAAITIAFMQFPLVGVVGAAFIPGQAMSMYFFTLSAAQGTKQVSTAYSQAGGTASEALGAIKTVAYLGIEPYVVEKYKQSLVRAMTAGIRKSLREGASLSILIGFEPLMYAAGYVTAGWLIYDDAKRNEFVVQTALNGTYVCTAQCSQYDERFLFTSPVPCDMVPGAFPYTATCRTACFATRNLTALELFWGYPSEAAYNAFVSSAGGSLDCGVSAGKALIAIVCLNMVGSALGQFPVALGELTRARVACAKVQQTLARVPPIDSFSDAGHKPDVCNGFIEIKNVYFAYPSAPSLNICNGYTLSIKAGEQCALSGPSGSGKSTIISLLERFYDPQRGIIELDGRDITTLNLKWLREQMGLVGQEPVLFQGTVADNIAYGKLNQASREEIEEAAKIADAHSFIMEVLSDCYETQVGQGGSRLSGGQKQRVAIARAMIKKPEVLLLDEATSALDSSAEQAVQTALDKIRQSKKRTTVTIAHRLSTIRASEQIAVIKKGEIIESGTWNELIELKGTFYELASKQQQAADEDRDTLKIAATSGGAGLAPSATDEIATRTSFMKTSFTAVSLVALGANPSLPNEPHEPKVKQELNKKKTIGAKKRINVKGRLLAMQDPGDRMLYFIGSLSSIGTGGLKPVTGLFSVYLLVALLKTDPDIMWEETIFWAWVLAICSIVMIACSISEAYCFGAAGQHLIKNLRHALMQKLMTMETGYFDFDENSAGELTMFLAEQVTLISALTGERLAGITKLLLNAITTFLLVFIFGHWTFALVCTAFIPVNVICFIFVMIGMGMVPEKPEKSIEQQEREQADKEAKAKSKGKVVDKEMALKKAKTAGQIVGEVVLGIRTLASFNAEKLFFQEYEKSVLAAEANALKATPLEAALAGLGWGGIIIFFGVQLLIGGMMQTHGVFGDIEIGTTCSFNDTAVLYLMVPILVLFGLIQTLGLMASSMADIGPANAAAMQFFQRIDLPSSPRDPSSTAGDILPQINGDISIKEVVFAYPTRVEFMICKGYSLDVEAGQVCALCGPSGSGKSTIVNLIERFYDPLEGSITIDGSDISTLSLQWLRQQIGYVGQEPVLFQGTIRENITMGAPKDLTHAKIETAAHSANAHDFILSLSNGYETQVGLRGGKLSGGQKQRVAIARALVREPSIMLLDEATSALDNTSEKIVQAALDDMMAKNKKTTFTIAHRLSTIRHADVIAVVSKGRIAEKGTHKELMMSMGLYSTLVLKAMGGQETPVCCSQKGAIEDRVVPLTT